jgi:hypothetical protein
MATTAVRWPPSAHSVSCRMGHSSIRITVDVYGHLIPGEKSHAADRLDASFGLKERQSA